MTGTPRLSGGAVQSMGYATPRMLAALAPRYSTLDHNFG